MATNDKKVEPIGTRYGRPIYRTNPSIPNAGEVRTRSRVVPLVNGDRAMVVNATGEILGSAQATYAWAEEVDQTRFVKLFLDGIRQTVGLSKAGLAVFELVYMQMRSNPGIDRIELNLFDAKDRGIVERTFRRGLGELLEREFLYASPTDGVFFVNIRYLFNGNRLNFIRQYYLKGSRDPDPAQGALDFDDQPPMLGNGDEPGAQ